jgi:hypothetical protein
LAGQNQNQQGQAAGAGPETNVGKMIPYERFAQVNAQMNQLRAHNAHLDEQLQALMARFGGGQGAAAGSAAAGNGDEIDPADRRLLDYIKNEVSRENQPIRDFIEEQRLVTRREQALRQQAEIAEAYPIFKDAGAFGRGAKLELTQKLALNNSQQPWARRSPLEIAEEVAAVWTAEQQRERQNWSQSLVTNAQAKQPPANAGAAVATGGAAGPMAPVTGKPVGAKSAGQLYRESLAARSSAAARSGQA